MLIIVINIHPLTRLGNLIDPPSRRTSLWKRKISSRRPSRSTMTNVHRLQSFCNTLGSPRTPSTNLLLPRLVPTNLQRPRKSPLLPERLFTRQYCIVVDRIYFHLPAFASCSRVSAPLASILACCIPFPTLSVYLALVLGFISAYYFADNYIPHLFMSYICVCRSHLIRCK